MTIGIIVNIGSTGKAIVNLKKSVPSKIVWCNTVSNAIEMYGVSTYRFTSSLCLFSSSFSLVTCSLSVKSIVSLMTMSFDTWVM